MSLVLDVNDMAKFISCKTGINIEIVLKVLAAEDEYLIVNGFTAIRGR